MLDSQMIHNPTFSVIMACHNAAPYVQQAIASVVTQTFVDWELIIVDDASQDDSLIYIEKAAIIEPRINVIKFSKNGGVALARNAAIKTAKGEWLAILDADDIFLPVKLEKQFEIIRQHNSNLVLVGGGCFHIDSEGLRGQEYKYTSNSKVLKTSLKRMLKFPPHSSLVYRKSAFLKVGGFNTLFARSEDFELLLRLGEIGDFTSCNLPLIEYRLHSTNISNQISKQGFSQLEYGVAGRVCQMLRSTGRADPSATGDAYLWHELMTHVAVIIRQSRYYEYINWKSNFKQDLQRSTNLPDKFHIITTHISKSLAIFIFAMRERISGNGLPDKIFKSWIAKK